MRTSHPEPEARAPRSHPPQPLSQSSFNLLGEGPGQRPDVHKSASSTVWQAQLDKASIVPRALEEEGRQTESMEQAHPSSSWPQPGAVGHWQTRTVGNVSAVSGDDLCCLQTPSTAAVQRSHSDLVHSAQTQGHSGIWKASLSCSALSGSPIKRTPGITSGQHGQSPAGLERDMTPEHRGASRTVGTSNTAWTLGESQMCVAPVDLGGITAHRKSPKSRLKATGQLATTSCHALPPEADLCDTRDIGISSHCQALWDTEILAFPKLMASVSESGLQAQHKVKFHCRLPGGLPGYSHCYAHPWSPSRLATEPGARTKDVWTMTSASDLASPPAAQDAAVQAVPMATCKAVATSPPLEAPVALHMLPEMTLGHSLEEAPSPVQEVRWDTEGMTWEVYGAAMDPEVLGVAIQKHLEMQFEQLHQTPTSKDSLSTEGHRGPLQAVMQSLRCPSCCGCSSVAPE